MKRQINFQQFGCVNDMMKGKGWCEKERLEVGQLQVTQVWKSLTQVVIFAFGYIGLQKPDSGGDI